LNIRFISPTQFLIDNQEALDLIRSRQINEYIKYIDTRFRHICNHEIVGDITGEHIATKDQVADIITKALGSEKFLFFHTKIDIEE